MEPEKKISRGRKKVGNYLKRGQFTVNLENYKIFALGGKDKLSKFFETLANNMYKELLKNKQNELQSEGENN